MTDSNGFTMYDFGNKENAGLSRPFLSGSNPYAANLLDTNNNEGNAMTATGFAEIRFLKDFKFTWTSGVNIDETRTITNYDGNLSNRAISYIRTSVDKYMNKEDNCLADYFNTSELIAFINYVINYRVERFVYNG